MMRRKIPNKEVEQNLMMTEACGATNCTMMKVGEAISIMMKVCGATKSISKVPGNLCETVYFMMRQKLLHRMKGGVWHYQSYDEGRTDSGRASSGWNPAFNLYFIYYIYT